MAGGGTDLFGHESVLGVLNGGGVVGGSGSAAAEPRESPARSAPDASVAPARCHLIEEAEYSMTSVGSEFRRVRHGVVLHSAGDGTHREGR